MIDSINRSGITKLMLFLALGLFSQFAVAQGFAGQVKTNVEQIRDRIVIVVGVVATISLLWQFAEGYMGRKTWPDVLVTCAWILGAGAAIALATWVFTTGQSITFG